MERRIFLYVAFVAALAACTAAPVSPSATPTATPPGLNTNACGMPPPVPVPYLWLASPQSGSTNVSTTIGELIVAGMPQGFYDTAKIDMTSSSGANVPVGAYTAAPSPSPTPYPTPPNFGTNYLAAPIPTLSPATTYTLTYTFTDFNGIPPACTGPTTLPLGSFSTK